MLFLQIMEIQVVDVWPLITNRNKNLISIAFFFFLFQIIEI